MLPKSLNLKPRDKRITLISAILNAIIYFWFAEFWSLFTAELLAIIICGLSVYSMSSHFFRILSCIFIYLFIFFSRQPTRCYIKNIQSSKPCSYFSFQAGVTQSTPESKTHYWSTLIEGTICFVIRILWVKIKNCWSVSLHYYMCYYEPVDTNVEKMKTKGGIVVGLNSASPARTSEHSMVSHNTVSFLLEVPA